ncbi:MAG: molybdopterin converting factor [Methylobacter sp.]|nr:MAG: molybdopterin converting factor [Methylobacter sp.]
MTVKLLSLPFDPWGEIQLYQAQMDSHGRFGATSVFVGSMRDFNDGDAVSAMTLEYYPGMTEKQLDAIIDSALAQWRLLDVLVVHRTGRIMPGEPIVILAVWSSHRGDAFDASRFIMEALKSKAPFWKKEELVAGGERWVEHNSCGYQPE